MGGDAFKKVQAGQRLEITAEAYNAFIDAARSVREHQQFGGDAKSFFRQAGIIRVRNASGTNIERFSVLGLSEPILAPSDDTAEFQRQVACDVIMPAAPLHHGRFVVLLEPLAAGEIGQAVVSGVTPVRLLTTPPQFYDRAEVIDSDHTRLRNVPHGSARVLWVEPTGDTVRWAIVRLDDGDYQAHVFILSNVPDAEGYYPGVVQRYEVATQTWESLFACKVVDVNQ